MSDKKVTKHTIWSIILILCAFVCLIPLFKMDWINAHYTAEQQWKFIFISIWTITGSMVILFIYMIISTIKYEKRSNKFRKELKIGDFVSVGGKKAEILEINDDKVKISMEIYKSSVHPVE